MPISTYTVLNALANRDPHSYEGEIARKTLATFRLFAFIIHDPLTHTDFNKYINHSFDEFDYLTGENLLFFALVDPPQDWLRHAANRAYYKSIKSWETEQLLNPDHAIVSTDKSLTAFTLANSLNIPSDMLPCLIVTDDFQANQFLWIRTCKEHIGEQLQRLGYIASRFTRPFRFDSTELDLCNGLGIESLSDSLAQALADLLSFIVASGSSVPHIRSLARDQARLTMQRLFSTLQAMKGKEVEPETFDNLCINISNFLAQLNEESDIRRQDIIRIASGLEQDSYQILQTAYKVLDLLLAEDKRGTKSILGPRYDFAPAVVCLSKVFEREANLSLVHWVRKELGISLPAYFNKAQPGIMAKLRPDFPNARPIDFNANRRGRWLAPGIGQSEIACSKLAQTKLPNGWDRATWDILLSHWRVIRERRNEAAHVDLVTEQPAFEVKQSLERLAAEHIFDRMCEMKTEYRGGPTLIWEAIPETKPRTLILGSNFKTELKRAEEHFAQGLIGECFKVIDKIRQNIVDDEEEKQLVELVDRANAVRATRLTYVEKYSGTFDRFLELNLKERCPLCGKSLDGATRCWEKSCEPAWDTVKYFALLNNREQAIMNLSHAAFSKLMKLLDDLQSQSKSD